MPAEWLRVWTQQSICCDLTPESVTYSGNSVCLLVNDEGCTWGLWVWVSLWLHTKIMLAHEGTQGCWDSDVLGVAQTQRHTSAPLFFRGSCRVDDWENQPCIITWETVSHVLGLLLPRASKSAQPFLNSSWGHFPACESWEVFVGAPLYRYHRKISSVSQT